MPAEQAADPIVVYGAPRSGTTYLEQILNSHPEIFISHETRVFAWLQRALALTNDHFLIANQREALVAHLRDELPSVIRDFYGRLAPGKRYWGDKNPHYADPKAAGSLDLVAELFPGALFIHIIRDGRDVVSSLVRKQHDEGRPWATFEQAHDVWKKHVRFGRAFGERVGSDRYLELRYEDLIADDVARAREMLRFLGLDPHPAVDAFCRSQREQRTPFKEPMRDLGHGIAASEWSTVLSLEEQARSLELIGKQLVLYGYETEASLARLRDEIAAALASR
jgi:Sulfotransferase family